MADRRQEIREMLAKLTPEKRNEAIASMVRHLNARNRLIEAVKGLPSPEKKNKTSP